MTCKLNSKCLKGVHGCYGCGNAWQQTPEEMDYDKNKRKISVRLRLRRMKWMLLHPRCWRNHKSCVPHDVKKVMRMNEEKREKIAKIIFILSLVLGIGLIFAAAAVVIIGFDYEVILSSVKTYTLCQYLAFGGMMTMVVGFCIATTVSIG